MLNLTMMFSIIRAFVDIDCNSLFHVIDCECIHARGHNLRLYKEHCNISCRLNAFVCRNINIWNRTVTLPLLYYVIQISPERLIQAGVSVSRVVQSAGEFIVVFPQSFTANVGCGFSVSESLHLAPASWFPLGCNAAQVSEA